jgi:hypothetical protein
MVQTVVGETKTPVANQEITTARGFRRIWLHARREILHLCGSQRSCNERPKPHREISDGHAAQRESRRIKVFAGNFPMKNILGMGNTECQPLPHFRLSGSFLGVLVAGG